MKDRYTWTPVGGSPTILDFSKCRCVSEFHQVLRKAFGFPAYYGENPDALWDLLDGFFGDREEEPWEVYVFGWANLENRFSLEFRRMYWSVFEDAEKEYPNVRFHRKS